MPVFRTQSRKIACPHGLTRKRADGAVEYFHTFVGATRVAPGHRTVLPLPPEFVRPQAGAAKQDCEPMAPRRWLARVGSAYAWLKPVYLGDDLYARQRMHSLNCAARGVDKPVSGGGIPAQRGWTCRSVHLAIG